MGRAKKADNSTNTKRMRPALTPEARENQMISLAMDLVEKRLREGTATSQETVHFLKLATAKERIEREKLERELELIEAKTKAYQSSERAEQLYEEAIKAFKTYSGQDEEDGY